MEKLENGFYMVCNPVNQNEYFLLSSLDYVEGAKYEDYLKTNTPLRYDPETNSLSFVRDDPRKEAFERTGYMSYPYRKGNNAGIMGVAINFGDAVDPGNGNGRMNEILTKEEQKSFSAIIQKLVDHNCYLTIQYSLIEYSGHTRPLSVSLNHLENSPE